MSIVSSQPVVDVEDVIIVLIVVRIVVHWLARLRQDAAGIVRRFILELRVTDVVRIDEVRGQLLQWLDRKRDGGELRVSRRHRLHCPI